jgi:DNA-binding CsgD family transcriptional regulator
MEHVEVAYEFCVIIIGVAALFTSVTWAWRTGDSDLGNFCIVYSLFTAVLVITVLKKYLALNVAGYTASAWFTISGILQMLSFSVVVAFIHFLLAIYRVPGRAGITVALVAMMVVAIGLVSSPLGAVLQEAEKVIHFGPGYRVAVGWYFASFTFGIILGYAMLGRVWNTDRRALVLGLLIFATVGYLDSLFSFLRVMRSSVAPLAKEANFLYSSIPYALFGIFVLGFFMRRFTPATLEVHAMPAGFVEKYGITEREQEIILKVSEGKSNAEIARELVISIATIKTHLHNIYAKMGVDSRYGLLARLRSGQ